MALLSQDMEIYLIVIGAFLTSLLTGLVVIPLIIRYCIRHRLFDQPNARKVHKTLVPRLGGICFFPIALMALGVTMGYLAVSDTADGSTLRVSLWTLSFFLSLLVIYVLGFLDDIIGIDAKLKFVVQILAASVLPISGLYLRNFDGLLGLGEVHWFVGAAFSIFIVVYICNAINLIDGIDGLAAGLSIIAFFGFLVMFMSDGLEAYSALIASMIGVLLAYIRYNVFGSEQHHTKIFMGDAGSLSIGFTLAFLFLKSVSPFPIGITSYEGQLVMVCSLFVVPVFDVVRVAVSRMKHHLPIFNPDKNHIHHKILRAGLNQHQTLAVILLFAVLVVVVDAVIVKRVNPNVVLLLDIVLWLIFNAMINHAVRKRGNKPFLVPNE